MGESGVRPSVVVNIFKRLSEASSLIVILLFHIYIASISTCSIWVGGTESCVYVPIRVELLSLW